VGGDSEKIEITHVEGRAGDIEESQAAIDRARTELEFEPTISLEEGLRDLASGSR
jgi:UDP-glucose 4-epimerase